MSSVWVSVMIPLGLAEFSGWAAWLAAKVARCAARRLSKPDARYAEEVTATVAAVPAPLARLVTAVGILAATPALRRGPAFHTRSADTRPR